MYNDKNNRNQNEDLKFIPLNISEPFKEKDSSWFPIVDTKLPEFSKIPNGFDLGFPGAINNSNMELNSLNSLDNILNNDINIQNRIQEESFEDNFDLEYPSETFSEKLFSYNKEDKCKKLDNNKANTTSMNSINAPRNYLEEPIHMGLLRKSNFESCLNTSYRDIDKEDLVEIESILESVRNNDSIMETFEAYNIPKPIYEIITKRIIKISLENLRYKGDE